jgi:hypothetical protein
MRAAALVCLAIACAALASSAAARPRDNCETAHVHQHDRAVFGHFASRAGANALKKRAESFGFQGIKIEDNGCGDFEVLIDGADTQAQRSSFAAEARKAGFPVTFQQTAPPTRYAAGQVYGVFGSLKSVNAANALMHRLSLAGFLYIDLAHEAARWLVVMPQVPVKNALSIAHEAATAGFHVQFRTGTQ